MISAIILAAGQSTRMGYPKTLLPWGEVIVIEQIISVFGNAGIDDILIVTGGARVQVEDIILKCKKTYPVRSVHNEDFIEGEMLASIQIGLRHLKDGRIRAALIGLGDQPQVEERSVRLIHEGFLRTNNPLVVPSFQMRRGHPWLVARPLWNELLEMRPPQTPRDFLNIHSGEIQYINVDMPGILEDLDTPEDYYSARPN